MQAEPQQEHEWLRQLIGQWTFESECPAEPGQPPQKFKGVENVRSIGALWTVAEGQGEMPGGGEAKMMHTLGYEPSRKCFVGTWLGSMMTWLWIYQGSLDESRRVLTLETEGPAMSGDGKLAKYRDVIELVDNDRRLLKSYLQKDDGEWQQFVTVTYRRSR